MPAYVDTGLNIVHRGRTSPPGICWRLNAANRVSRYILGGEDMTCRRFSRRSRGIVDERRRESLAVRRRAARCIPAEGFAKISAAAGE